MKIRRYSGKNAIEVITEHSTNASEKLLRIFELAGSLSEYVAQDAAERLRQRFVDNRMHVRELTNLRRIPDFTRVDGFDAVWQARYIPGEISRPPQEYLVYDDVFASYFVDAKGVQHGYEIYDTKLADTQKQLFDALWRQGSDLHKSANMYESGFYTPYGVKMQTGLPVIIYPCCGLEKALPRKSGAIETHLERLAKAHPAEFSTDLEYCIAIVWNQGGHVMTDLWKYSQVESWGSGPLVDVTVFSGDSVETQSGVGAGDGLLVLGEEERLRRQSPDIGHYVFGDIMPHLPAELLQHGVFAVDD